MGERVQMRMGAAALVAAALVLAAAGCGRAVGLPAAFPRDLPLPADARVRTVRDLGPKGLVVVLETREAFPGAAGAFGGRMLAAGWTAVAETALEGAVFTSFRKGERSVAVGASASGGLTRLGVSVVERPFNEWEGDQG